MAWVLLFLLPLALTFGQSPCGTARELGAGVTPPKPGKQPEPKYSGPARKAQIQGAVLLRLVVDEKGEAQCVTVIRPLGWGLDEEAVAAAKKWRFQPATLGAKAVAVRTLAEIRFRLLDLEFDGRDDDLRRRFNSARDRILSPNTRDPKSAIDSLLELTQEKYAPALYLYGLMLRDGKFVPQDKARGMELLQKAADADHPGALLELGRYYQQGVNPAQDREKGRKLLDRAALLGNPLAQLLVGDSYELGADGYPRDPVMARSSFRLCAAYGSADCQYRLGKLLLAKEGRSGDDMVEAAGWLELAQSQGVPEAEALAQQARATLPEPKLAQIPGLKEQMVHK